MVEQLPHGPGLLQLKRCLDGATVGRERERARITVALAGRFVSVVAHHRVDRWRRQRHGRRPPRCRHAAVRARARARARAARAKDPAFVFDDDGCDDRGREVVQLVLKCPGARRRRAAFGGGGRSGVAFSTGHGGRGPARRKHQAVAHPAAQDGQRARRRCRTAGCGGATQLGRRERRPER